MAIQLHSYQNLIEDVFVLRIILIISSVSGPFKVHEMYVCLFFVAFPPKSTAMVMTGWSVQLTTLFPGQA